MQEIHVIRKSCYRIEETLSHTDISRSKKNKYISLSTVKTCRLQTIPVDGNKCSPIAHSLLSYNNNVI